VKSHLITIGIGSRGDLAFAVHSQEMDKFLLVGDSVAGIDEPSSQTHHGAPPLGTRTPRGTQEQRNERRVMLAEEFRQLARKLEAGIWPFTDSEPEPEVARGAAEREIDRLALHIKRLQDGDY
jgi:hypothetical protein